jgi:hypothetical protein
MIKAVVTVIKLIVESIVGALAVMVIAPVSWILIVFVGPLLAARDAWEDEDYFLAAIYLTLGSWPTWIIIYALFKT